MYRLSRDVEWALERVAKMEWWQTAICLTVFPLSMLTTLLLLIPCGIFWLLGAAVRRVRD